MGERSLLGRWVRTWSLLSWGAFVGCGGGAELPPPAADLPPYQGQDVGESALPPEALEVAPALVLHGADAVRPLPPLAPAVSFQPAFYQALRWSYSVSTVTTFRMRLPVDRAGKRLRITFRAGDGSLTLQKVTVARAGSNGALASAPVALTFSGQPGFAVGARTHAVSDPVQFPVNLQDELAVSFEVKGALSVSAIDAFPGSFMRQGSYAETVGAIGGSSWQRAIGVTAVHVEAETARVFVALGDSITEGYIDTYNDTRNAWPSLAGTSLGVPIVNAGVSGQGFYDALQYLDREVLSLPGVTDCVILLGTNDLGAVSDAELQARMTRMFDRLKPHCKLWVSTLLPKEKSNYGSYEAVKASRLVFNGWLRQQTQAELVDLEAVTRSSSNVHLFIDGLDVDGIHPSKQGHQVMAAEVVRALRSKGL
ncbi:GDSL-type esterase/lipase family protein [Stigmatella sp. ncwal1]|uniref:GDSL-type esterase/lipase family protein n=1 Tax=Stigmatella ashevillensis TaxID=2995309 RepID=A0ABT5D7I7_9BACT|nr:GDSL-type esterase/lipase family protein [Stigmatella ashevillena]MDC0708227.1 GDSL-type esterase/lipase family protein [Stigmatella ashevillena]